MRHWTMALAALTLTGGCITTEMMVKPGVTYDRYERDVVGCATTSTQKVPTNTQVGWAPYVGLYSVDTNSTLRQKHHELCLRDKGYSKVAIPVCEGPDGRAALAQARGRQDRARRMSINGQSCYVVLGDGSRFLYTPAEG
ncbi:MAG: hypothetical protein ACPH5G_16715 [Pseudooceanicola atlanticus]